MTLDALIAHVRETHAAGYSAWGGKGRGDDTVLVLTDGERIVTLTGSRAAQEWRALIDLACITSDAYSPATLRRANAYAAELVNAINS